MKKVLIVSTHKSYDYRIERHIKSLLKIDRKVVYYNITNEEYPLNNIKNDNYEYVPLKIENKKSPKVLKVVFFLIKELNKNTSDYIFIQDSILLLLVPFIKRKTRIVFDIHEIPEEYSKIEKIFFKYSCKRINPLKITALNTNEGIFMNNFPLLSDFELDNNIKRLNNPKNKYNFIYSGMITEENRQMLKTLEVFDLLLMNEVADKVFLIGPLANRIYKEHIEKQINKLQKKYPHNFYYYGPKEHNFVTKKFKESDFSFNLLNRKDDLELAPNKLFESMVAGAICITNHTNFCNYIPLNLLLLVEKVDTPYNIYHKILEFMNNNNIVEIKENNRRFILENKYYWEVYLPIYERIFL